MRKSKNSLWKLAQRLEWWWWKRYLKSKNPEDYLVWKRKYWTDFLQNLPAEFHFLTENKILDAGCGPAGIFIILEKNTVTALDPLLCQYDSLPHFDRSRYPYCTFETMSLEDYTLENDYDYIFSLNAINHVADIACSIKNIYNNLKNGGKAIISTDVHRYQALKHILRIIPTDALHPQQHDKDDYHTLMRNIGFKNIQAISLKPENPMFDYICFIAEK
jgi:2-polyprenyl-6-hydroxyphenyl methylase/3-demethylubiquinone-9 3-methyltransferase